MQNRSPATSEVRENRTVHRYRMSETRSATASEWNGWLVNSAGGGHILQSHEWGEFKRAFGWKPVRLALERDGEIVGLGQFLVYNTLPVPGTLMYCVKGPWLPWDDEEAVRTFFKGAHTVARREGVHTIKIEPEVLEVQSGVKSLLRGMGFRRANYDVQFKTTMTMDLSPPDEVLLARMKPKTRYNIRLGMRKDLLITEDNSPEALRRFYELYASTAERDLFFPRPWEYVEAAWRQMHASGRAHLFLGKRDCDLLGGMLIYTLGRKYWYMFGASANHGRNLMPNYSLQWHVMRWARSQGLTYYDMVAIPNPDNLNEQDPMWGLYRFKSGFGGEVKEFLGCLDLPVNRFRAQAWYKLEPVYYKVYKRLKRNVYY